MAVCPNGHESADAEYCEECGFKIGGSGAADSGGSEADPDGGSGTRDAADAADDSGEQQRCPECGTPRAGRFCERDGYDFVTDELGGGQPAPADGGTGRGGTASLVVVADPEYFETVRSASGPDAGGLAFPAYCPPRRFRLRGEQLVIGRRSRSRGIEPDVDLVGPPEDPGVSHLHAMLVAQPGGGWAVVDMESANGTYLNGGAEPIQAHTPVPLHDGDWLHLGAWTRITVQLADDTTR